MILSDSIAESHSPSYIVEGPDFRFGRDRQGSIETLQAYESLFGYRTIVIDPVEAQLRNQHVVRVSSTLLRWLLARGRVEDAHQLLGRPFDLECPVVKGDRRGRTIGVPTANLDHGPLMLPADGIYAGRAMLVNENEHEPALSAVTYPAAISVGSKPTFGRHPRICEAHLIGYDGPMDHYGWTIRVEFHHWLRDQLVYREFDSLIEQLRRDLENTIDRMGRVDTPSNWSSGLQSHDAVRR
jgi:riboflavin kinase / FMN adenylyltransferase